MGNNQTLVENSSHTNNIIHPIFNKIPWNTAVECYYKDGNASCISFTFLLTPQESSCYVIDNKHDLGGSYVCCIDEKDTSKIVFKNKENSKNELFITYCEETENFTIMEVKKNRSSTGKSMITFNDIGHMLYDHGRWCIELTDNK